MAFVYARLQTLMALAEKRREFPRSDHADLAIEIGAGKASQLFSAIPFPYSVKV